MSIGCGIYFTPVDRAWIGTPAFICRLAALFGAVTFERFCVWQALPNHAGDLWNDHRLVSEVQNMPVEEAIGKLRTDRGWSTVMDFASADTGLLTEITDAMDATVPGSITKDFVPLDISVRLGEWELRELGEWELRDQGGDLTGAGMCYVELRSFLGYPVEMQQYLRYFLAVPEAARFQMRLEEFSDQPWEALIELI